MQAEYDLSGCEPARVILGKVLALVLEDKGALCFRVILILYRDHDDRTEESPSHGDTNSRRHA